MSQSPICPGTPEALAFYAECLRCLEGSGLRYLLAGTHAVNAYTGMDRPVKDLDLSIRKGEIDGVNLDGRGHLEGCDLER